MELPSVDALLGRISYHAVTRYVQRVLGVPELHGPFATNELSAAAHCAAVGLSIAAVRRAILTPPVAAGLIIGASAVRTADFTAVLATGGVVTVYERWRETNHGAKITGPAEGRRESMRALRRYRGKRIVSEAHP